MAIQKSPRSRFSRLPALLRGLLVALPLAAASPTVFADVRPALNAFRAGDFPRALTLVRPLAAKQDPQAMYLLGVMYEQGKGVDRDDPTAVKWYAAASRKGNASSQYNLARMYLDGRGVNKNPARAREWLDKAAAQGHPESKALLASMGGAPVAAATTAPAAAPATAPATAPAATPTAPVASAAPAAKPEPPRAPSPAASKPEPAAPPAEPIARPPEAVDRTDFPARGNEVVKLVEPATPAAPAATAAAATPPAAPVAQAQPAAPATSAPTSAPAAKSVTPPVVAAAPAPASPPAVPAAAPAAKPAAPAADTPVLAAYAKGDYDRARALAIPLSQREDGPGMYVLGKLYETGQGGVKRDDYTAVKWLAAASRKGNYAPAQYALARMYIDGRGVGKNRVKAKEWLDTAAAQGHAESQKLLAEMNGGRAPVVASAAAPAAAAPAPAPAPVETARPTEPASKPAAPPAVAPPAPPVAEAKPAEAAKAPPVVARAPETKAAEAPKAPEPAPKPAAVAPAPAPAATPPQTAMLSRPEAPGSAPTQASATPGKAGTGPRQYTFNAYSASATQASINALNSTARRGESLPIEAARAQLAGPMSEVAMRYWEAEAAGDRKGMADARAAISGNGPMAIGLAKQMMRSTVVGERAMAALLSSIMQNGPEAAAEVCTTYRSAAELPNADHVPAQYHGALCLAQRDAKQSLAWLQAAGGAGHAGALEMLGRACIESSEKNWGCAMHYFEQAAQRGRGSSMTLYGWVLSNQPSAGDKDFTTALDWYRKGAGAGDLFAQNNLGEMYERGRGTRRDDKAARQWYGRAAEAGFGPGQFNYARLLLVGTGGPRDKEGAVQWLQKAERNGVPQAKAALQQIATQ